MTKEEIRDNYLKLLEIIRQYERINGRKENSVKIVAVSKTHPIEYILWGIEAGIEIFGENYVQELKSKYQYFLDNNLTAPEFHFIGHLQTNKVKYIASFITMIHSVDSVKLAKEIDRRASDNNRIIDILVQVNTSGERSKFGCKPEELEFILNEIKNFENINIKGLMTIGSFSGDENIYRAEFRLLKQLRDDMQNKFSSLKLEHLSMGMSHDFIAAIEEGATIVRIGTNIFGLRNYNE